MNAGATVGVAGDGPAAEAVRAALGDGGYEPISVQPATAGRVDLAVVIAPADDDRFAAVDRQRVNPWLAVALGGIGGRFVDGVDASVAVLQGAGPCYRCLTTRVQSTTDEPPTGTSTVPRPVARLAGAHAGRLALTTVEATAAVGTVLELPYAERQLLPVPGCDCDPGPSRAVDRTDQAVDLDAAVERAEGGVDPRLGPVETIGEAESFPAPYYLATLCDTSGFSDVRASRHAAGVAADWNPAFVKAIGEALERYSAGVYRTATFVEAPAAAVDDAVVPERFVRPGAAADIPPETPIQWVAGENLHTADPVHLPADRVQFPPAGKRVGPAITTGLGLGTSGAGALISGVTEVIERDATMLAWYSTFEPLGLAVEDPGFETLARRARSEDLEVTPLLVTQDIDVPVVTAAVHRDDGWPQFAVGSAAALDPVAAARSALEEALQNWMELGGLDREGAAEEEPTLARYATAPPEAAELLAIEETVPAANVGPATVPTGMAALDALLDRLAATGLTAYAARLTPRDVDALGFEAVRVVVPEAQPLFTGERFFGERARTVPRALGFRPRLDRSPHPYP